MSFGMTSLAFCSGWVPSTLSTRNQSQLQLNVCNTRRRTTCELRGPTSPAPDYTSVDGVPTNAFFMATFQRALDEQLDEPLSGSFRGYDRVSRSIRALATQYRGNNAQLRDAALRVLQSLIPMWLPKVFRAVFVRFDTVLSAKMCAFVTVLTTQWLMGHSKISEEDSTVVEIERCRYLEEGKLLVEQGRKPGLVEEGKLGI